MSIRKKVIAPQHALLACALLAPMFVAAGTIPAAAQPSNTSSQTVSATTQATTNTSQGNDYDASWTNQALYEEVQLATNGQGGFPNYRIPALAVAPNGDLLASYDGRPTGADSPGPNSILQRRSTDGGVTWGPQTVIAAGKTSAPIHGYSDPSYVVDRVTGEIFNFHVYSQDVGLWGGQPLDNGDDRKIMHANVSRSTDNGQTWMHETITADITPDLTWRSRFATAGQGIQLKYGPHAGRLIQQYTVMVANGSFRAVSVYSDDHGQTWQSGVPVGTGMDENKVVELSDGRVMMNSRDSAGSKLRKIAISEDGGHTYGPISYDQTLIDPTNNAGIHRAFPNAPQGSAEAKILLFSNAASQSGRNTGTIRMSCDDGQTWPVSKVFQAGGMAYSTMATLPDGNIGLLYEPNSGNGGIRYARFNLAWLGGVCASVQVSPTEAAPGTSTTVDVTVNNQTSSALAAAEVSLNLPAGWTGGTIAVPAIAAQSSSTVSVPVSVPAQVTTGDYVLNATYGTVQGSVSAKYTFTVTPPAGTLVTVVPQVANAKENYNVGDVIRINYNVRNWGSQTVALIPSGNLTNFTRPGTVNCGYSALAAGASYTCAHGFVTVTEALLAAGTFTPETDWSVRAGGYGGTELTLLSVDGPQISISRAPIATVSATITNPKAEYLVGDTITYKFTVSNKSAQTLAVVPTGNLAGFSRPTVPNCGYSSLAAGGTYECTTATHVVTEADSQAGSFVPTSQWVFLAGNYQGSEVGRLDYTGPTAQVKRPDVITISASITSAPKAAYVAGDVIRYNFQVTNLRDHVVSVVPNGNLDGFNRPTPPNCGYQNLAALGSYTCTTASHTLTQAEVDAGSFTPQSTWEIRTGNYAGSLLHTQQHTGPTVQLP